MQMVAINSGPARIYEFSWENAKILAQAGGDFGTEGCRFESCWVYSIQTETLRTRQSSNSLHAAGGGSGQHLSMFLKLPQQQCGFVANVVFDRNVLHANERRLG